MKDKYAIRSVSEQIQLATERIATTSEYMDRFKNDEKLLEIYERQLISQLKDLQELTLFMTELILYEEESATDEDGVFASGELNDNIGDESDCEEEDEKILNRKSPKGGGA